MTHEEQRIWLIEQLLAERSDASDVKIPVDEQEQKNLLRGLMNIRMPEPVSDEFLRVQDEYLTAENKAEGEVRLEDLSPVESDERIYLWQGDMSRLAVDAVVNPANSGFTGCYQWLHSCLDNILGSKAGIELRLYCNDIIEKQGYPEPTGQAKITPAFNLPAQHIIHRASAAIPRIYRNKFHRDIYKDLHDLQKGIDENDPENSALDSFSLELFEDISYIMAKHADPQGVPDTPDEWLDQFGTFSIYQVLPEIIELWGLNVQTQVESKKNFERLTGK